MMELYRTILYEPLFNAVIFLYNVIPGNDFGVAIIALTVIIRVIFFPLTVKTLISQRAMNMINPQVQAIKEKFKNDAQAQSAAIMKLYKDNNVNPLSGCLPLLIQLPILIALYQAFGAGFKPENLALIYNFIDKPEQINPISLGFLDITIRSIYLAIATGFFQFIQLRQNQNLMKNTGDKPNEMQTMTKQMLYIFPIMIIVIGWNLPAGLLLYWVATTLFSMAEQAYIRIKYK